MSSSTGGSDIEPDNRLTDVYAEAEAHRLAIAPVPFSSVLFKWLRRLTIASVLIAVVVAGVLYLLLQMAKSEPAFYRAALDVDPKLQRRNGSEMESRILNLRNSVLSEDAWSAQFSEAQINGWLAWDLKQKFPDLIPPQISDPRLMIKDETVTLAFRCSVKPFRGVAIIEADVFLTGVINQIGIRIKSIHSGMIPVPIAAFADQITDQAKNSGLEIQWNTEESESVAIIDLPDAMIKPNDGGSYIELKTFEIGEGGVTISGITHPPDF